MRRIPIKLHTLVVAAAIVTFPIVTPTTSVSAAISKVQSATGGGSATFSVAPSVGNVVIATCFVSAALNSASVTDSRGNTYSLAAPVQGTSGTRLGVYYAVVAQTGAPFRVSCAANSSVSIHEYSGIDTTTPIDAPGVGVTRYGKSLTSPTITTATYGATLFEAIGLDSTANVTLGSGFTLANSMTSPWRLTTATKTVASPLSSTASATLSRSVSAKMVVAAFRASNAPAPTAPTVGLTSPAHASTVSGSVLLTAEASSTDTSTVSGVQFKINGSSAGPLDTLPPYEYAWNSLGVPDGSYVITATASTTAGLSATSDPVTVDVDNIPPATAPIVTITSPSSGATLSNVVTLSADAQSTDTSQITGVQFRVDGQNIGAPDLDAPYTIEWNSASVPNGQHTLSAVATTGAALSAESAPVVVTTDNAPQPTPPAVNITSPSQGATVQGTVSISVNAVPTDLSTISTVTVSTGGTQIGTSSGPEPYVFPWDTTTLVDGLHSITVVAVTSAGQSATASVQVAVANTPPPVSSAPAAMPIISNGRPVFASSHRGAKVPANANTAYSAVDNTAYDVFGNHDWESYVAPTTAAPQWLAYDLSAVPLNERGRVDLIWYNYSGAYMNCCFSSLGSVPQNYSIEGHTAPSGTAPTSGWVELVAVANNDLRIREHSIDLTGYNWVRIIVTKTIGNARVRLMHMDVHDTSRSNGLPEDSWLFLGDSITAGTMDYAQVYWQSPSNYTFASLIRSVVPTHFPAQTNGGITGTSAGFALEHIDSWLTSFPGRYVDLSYGTNDAASSLTATQFYQNYELLVQKVIAKGKVPIVPMIPWTSDGTYNRGASGTNVEAGKIATFNAKLRELYVAYPQIVKGPDFHQLLFDVRSIAGGAVHPDGDGYGVMRQVWACQALLSVYKVAPTQLASTPMCAPYMSYLR